MTTKIIEIAVATFVVMAITMIMPDNSLVLAQSTDDGYTYPDDATPEEKEEIDKQEQKKFEESGLPEYDEETDNDNDDDNGDDGDDPKPNPYCDKVSKDYRGTCHDRKDYSDSTGLYPCNDGTNKVDWRDCKDATENKDYGDNNNGGSSGSNTQSQPLISGTLIDDIAFCKRVGEDDARNRTPFDRIAFDECPNDVYGQNSYLDGFTNGQRK